VENEINSTPPEPVPAAPVPAPVAPAAVIFDPRRRIRELLSIPDRDRTDAEWDELNELEIQTAPGNRASGNIGGNSGGGGQPSGYTGKPMFPGKNRPKGGRGPHKPGGGGGGRPQQQGGKPVGTGNPNNNKPRPA